MSNELENLREQLREAQETLQAIRSGDVDALVVDGIHGERMFTLSGADEAYRVLVEDMSEGALTVDIDGTILYANSRFAQMLKSPLEKVLSTNIYTWFGEEHKSILLQLLQKNKEEWRHKELSLITSDGSVIPVYLSVSNPHINKMPDIFCLVITDLTEQKYNEKKHNEEIIASEKLTSELLKASNESKAELAHANRALSVLSKVNRALVHSTTQKDLLQAICRAIVQQADYKLAWVGYIQDGKNRPIEVMASASDESDGHNNVHDTLIGREGNIGPSRLAIDEGTTQICQDISSNPLFESWRDIALKYGYAANIVFPLHDSDGSMFGIINVYAGEVNAFTLAEIKLLEEMASDLAFGVRTLKVSLERKIALEENERYETLSRQSLEQSIETIASTVEARDPYTAGHERRVGELATAIAIEMKLPQKQVNGIHLAAIIHDLGKIKIPAEILSKPGKLSDIEFMFIKTHPQAGYDILKDVLFPWPIADIILQHHEKLDGSGYPNGLKSEQILLEAKIITVADVVEAMSSHRPYRPALGIEVALNEIRRGSGTVYDSSVCDACIKLFNNKEFKFSTQSL
jgi:PAS domain S-box-containing protein